MKKTIIVLSAIIFAFLVAFFSFYFISTAPKNAGDFAIEDYSEIIQDENFHTDDNYGEIADYKSAASAGKKAILETFENAKGGIFEWMGWSVQYNAEADAYCIRTYHIRPMFGGAYGVIIQSDGTVMAIWGEK